MTVDAWDADGDGYSETLLINTDGDAAYDAVSSDTDLDGVADTTWVDADNNGVYEAIGVDGDEDGEVDQIWTDADQDGVTDGQPAPDNQNSVIPAGQPGGPTPDPQNSVIPAGQPGGPALVAGPVDSSTGGTGLDALVNTTQYQTDPEFRAKVDEMIHSQNVQIATWVEDDHQQSR